MVKREWFKTYKVGDEPGEFDLVIQSWDTANKATELSDYSVCTTWGKKGPNLHLLHVLRKRMEYPDLKRAVQEQATRFNATTILIEDKSSGTELIQELIREGLHGVTRYDPSGRDKVMRMHSVTSMIENGFVYLPDKADWLADYLHEMTTFPKGRFDDQCDSTSQALDWVKKGGDFDRFVRSYKALAEKVESEVFGKEVEPCPFCRSRSTSPDGPEVRCLDCGKRWDRPVRTCPRITRADMLNGRWGF
jgi:predicted phage terminase large subunit-like protein